MMPPHRHFWLDGALFGQNLSLWIDEEIVLRGQIMEAIYAISVFLGVIIALNIMSYGRAD